MIGTIRNFTIFSAAIPLLIGGGAQAAYPERQVKIMVGIAAGGSADTLARVLAKKLSEKWGQPVIVENRDGATGTISEDIVAHSPPDGYTLNFVINTHTVTASQMKLNYDPAAFVPVVFLETHPDVLLTNADQVPSNTLKEFIAYVKARPGKLNYGAVGLSSPPYLQMRLLMHRTGIEMANITYKGTAPALVALLGGEIQATMGSVSTAQAQIASGKVKALGVTSIERIPQLPKVPTIAEAGDLPGFDEGVWDGVLAPAGTPKEIVTKLHDDFTETLHADDMKDIVEKQGWGPKKMTSEEFGKFLKEDTAKWAAILKDDK